ncbi:MAG TPA: hypothetical protein VNK04_06720 [Gemmataceae bacterium]|nr:hypothetical protein [Gemmataceae bacterium]
MSGYTTSFGTLGSGILDGGPPSQQFSPDQVAGLKLWLKADAITGLNDGDAVTTWEDSSGQNNDATQSTVAKKPTYQTNEINGKPCVRFDGFDDCLQTPAFSVGPLTAFVVLKLTTLRIIYEQSANANEAPGFWLYGSTHSTLFVHKPAGGTARDRPGGLPTGAWQIVTQRCDGTHAGHKLWINGDEQSLTDNLSSNPGTAEISDVLNIGARNNGAAFASAVDIAELLIYDAAVSDSDRQLIENYLNNKYAIF